MKTSYKVAVTYEFDNKKPLTWRGDIVANKPETVVFRAIRLAKNSKEVPSTRYWTSLVVVILERESTDSDSDSDSDTDSDDSEDEANDEETPTT